MFPIITLTLNNSINQLKKFNPLENYPAHMGYSDFNLSFIPEINYDSLNELWYEHKIEMLIITPNKTDFIETMKPLMDWKNEKGVKTIILSNFSLYSGRDDPEKIRNMIKSYDQTENIQWILLVGDAENNLIPIRYVYNPDVLLIPGNSEYLSFNDYYKPTDFYYADLTGSWDNDGDNIWGESSIYNAYGIDEITWNPDVYVGRFPAGNINELEEMVNKTLKYEKDPYVGNWMNRMLLAGAISSYYGYPDTTDEDEARLTEYIWNNYVKDEMIFTHLHKTTDSFTPISPDPPNSEAVLDNTNFDTNFDLGYSTIIFAGHGEPTRIVSVGISGSIYDSSDASSSNNINMPSLFYGDACTTSPYDMNNNSIGEILIKRPNAGAIGYIGGLRATWYFQDDNELKYLNRANAKLFWKEFFEEKKYQQGKALYDSKIAYMNSDIFSTSYTMNKEWERKNVLTYNLLGDPEVDIYTDKPIDGTDPFTKTFYEGQLISVPILDNQSEAVPYARVHFQTSDGKYYTTYANKNGIASFRVPAQENEVYNVTITGHNLKPSYFNFQIYPDNNKPELLGIELTPTKPSTSDKIAFTIKIKDNQSGIESIYLILSRNSSTDYSYYELSNEFDENDDIFTFSIDRLAPGFYSYFIVGRDYANNSNVFYNSAFSFSIPKPMIDYIFPVLVYLIIGIAGISFFVLFKGLQKYSRILEKKEKLM
ncbi:MAG: C25 family cysteine peptidase [Promethearchaeota archaeon]